MNIKLFVLTNKEGKPGSKADVNCGRPILVWLHVHVLHSFLPLSVRETYYLLLTSRI